MFSRQTWERPTISPAKHGARGFKKEVDGEANGVTSGMGENVGSIANLSFGAGVKVNQQPKLLFPNSQKFKDGEEDKYDCFTKTQ